MVDKKRKIGRREFIALSLGLAVGGISTEFLTGKFIDYESNCVRVEDDRLYALKANRSSTYQGYNIETNNLGMRDNRQLSFGKKPGTKRVLVIGDSHVMAHGVEMKDSFTHLLEERLNKRRDGSNYEVWPAGVCGYNARQEAAVLEHFKACSPDIVVVCSVDNDICLPLYLHSDSVYQSALLEIAGELWSKFNGSIHRKNWRGLINAPIDPETKLPLQEFDPALVDEKYASFVGPESMSSSYRMMVDSARKACARPIFFVDYCNLDPKREDKGISPLEKEMNIWAKEAGFEVIDIAPGITRTMNEKKLDYKRDLCVSPNDPHANEMRHRMIAEQLYSYLIEH